VEKANYDVTMLCRVLGVGTSTFYDWQRRREHPSPRTTADAALTDKIRAIHAASRSSYGSPRVWAELRLGEGVRCSRKRVERLMRLAGIQGLHRRRFRGCTRRNPSDVPSDDLVNRLFTVDGADRLWVSDVTEHPTNEGKVYVAVVLDAWSRRVIGWSIADHIRSELVVDALQMALWRRRPPEGQAVCHSDHGSQYTSWAFGRRLRLRVSSAPWARSATRTTTPWPRASSRLCSVNCSTSTAGRPAASSLSPCSSGSRVGTTPTAVTRASATSARSITREASPMPQSRHDHHNQPVR
jgi:putative transposase